MAKTVEFGVFMPVGEGGWIRSTTAPPVPATYAHNREVALLAEDLGLDFLLAMAKWRGFGGASNHWDKTIESLTMISALAEVTQRVRLMPTVHTLAFNVALVAKMIVTLDQISNGRAGLNVVSGWYRDELNQMGLWPDQIDHSERYDLAREWVHALKQLWTEDRVTFHGKYIHLEDCISNPKPIQKPCPPIICAGNSDVGLRFTVEEADACFLLGATHEEAAQNSRRAKQIAAELGKTTRTYAMVMVIPGETDAEGIARMEHYNAGVDRVAKAAGTQAHLEEIKRTQAKGLPISPSMQNRIRWSKDDNPYIPGYPYVGSAASIARQFEQVIEWGDFDGFMLTFPDFVGDLKFFGERVMPILAHDGFVRPLAQAA